MITALSIALCAVTGIAAIIIARMYKANRSLMAETRRLELDYARADERLTAMKESAERQSSEARESFASIAAETLINNSKALGDENRRMIAELIAPMKDNLDNFRRSYTDAYVKESEKRAMLEQQINELFNLNRIIGDETRRLGDALKGNASVQGQWGELVLENILERSGLTRGQDYHVQKTVETSESKARPDIIISCPGERNIVVDSKVSLSDYMRMLNASDRQTVKAAGEAHLSSMRKHIAELRRKSYQDLLDGRKADFVMMFVPHEGAYIAAMQLDNTLWQTAFDNRVIIVSPTHLVSVIKLVEMLWRQEKQNRHAIEIAELGAKMLDKLGNFFVDMGRIKSNLDSAQRAYDAAMIKLDGRGGVRSIGENMRDKGIKCTRELSRKDSTLMPDENP